MITKQIESISEEIDFVTAKKLCRGVFGFEPKFLPQGSSARRNLFASDDEEDKKSSIIVSELLSEVTKEMAEKAAREWNFDFMTETPMEGGRYLWEKVRGCDVPEWYTHTETTSKKYQSSDADERENTVLVQVCTNNELRSRNVKCNTKPKLVQTSIRGWASRVQKKRRTSTRLRLKRLDDTARCGCSGASSRLLTHYILRGASKSS